MSLGSAAFSTLGFLLADEKNPYPKGSDNYFMFLALQQARLGLGRTSPNPPVGAVLVKDGEIIAQDFHPKAGELHAEARALGRVDSAHGAVLYVTLEPCSHHGKTPPCAEHVIRAGVSRVVVGVVDPNPIVHQKGLKILTDAGIEVAIIEDAALKMECESLIAPFKTGILSMRSYVIAKMATSLDGKIASQVGKQYWLTQEASQQLVHHMRDAVDAVGVGINTVLIDNPRLTMRAEQSYHLKRPNPVRVVWDAYLKIPLECNMTSNEAKTIVVCSKNADKSKRDALKARGVTCISAQEKDGKIVLLESLQALYQLGISSILLEGGGQLFSSFYAEQLVDEMWWFTAPNIIGAQGVPAVALPLAQMGRARNTFSCLIGDDILTITQPN